MEDVDEFGDLYTDVLQPLTASFRSQYPETDAHVAFSSSAPSHSYRIDLNADGDKDTLYGSDTNTMKPNNINTSIGLKLNVPIKENSVGGLGSWPDVRRFDLNLDSNPEVTLIEALTENEGGNGVALKTRVLAGGAGFLPKKDSGGFNFMEEENDINIVLEEGDNKDDDLVEKENNLIDGNGELYLSATQKENAITMVDENMGFEQNILCLSEGLENQDASNFDDEWESEESEDGLQIVLNDNSHAPIGIERMPGMHDEDDEDGEPLVIVADNGDVGHHLHHQKMMMMMEEQEWVGDLGHPGIDGEKKELGDTMKASVVGGTATQATVHPRIVYNNHMYHHSFHSQFKYVRPGAPPLPGATPLTSGGTSGHVRPPAASGLVAGRGRGDWRPSGLKGALPTQKGFHPGYGTPVWGTNAAGRGYGSGLDFTLPSHKTIFEVDIDSFEDKPWNLPGIEISDFFNFGLEENSWKDYAKQLEQLRLETTMQSKICVYESGRAEQDYDPDLPPELAAAVGIQDIPSENANLGNSDAGPTDFAREFTRPPLPVGRPIPVETGSGERLPSTDTRRLRMHDSDAVIEIVCQGSADDDVMIEHHDSDQAEGNFREGGEVDDLRHEQVEDINDSLVEYKLQKREHVREAPSKNISGSDGSTKEDSKLSAHYNDSDTDFAGLHDGRSAEGRVLVGSPKTIASDNEREKETVDYHNEDSFDTGDGRQSSFSSFHASDVEQDTVNRDNSTMNDESFDVDTNQMAMDVTTRKTLEDNRLMQSSVKREKIISRVEQLSQENDNRKVAKDLRSSGSSKARSASSKDNSKDYQKFRDSVEDEVLQEKYPHHSENFKRLEGDDDNVHRKWNREKDETGRCHSAMKGKDDPYSRKGAETDSSFRWHEKSKSTEWRKESDIFEGSRYGRDEDLQRGRIDSTKRMHGGDTGSRSRGKARESERTVKDEHQLSRKLLDNGGWRGPHQDQEIGSRQRDRDDYLKCRSEKDDYLHSKRKKEEIHVSREHAEKGLSYNHRDSSIRRKRERDDDNDYRKRDDQARIKDADLYHARQKEESQLRDRSGRQKEHDEWHRHKQSHEEIFSRREREETRPAMRSGQVSEDKTVTNHSRGKDEYKVSGRVIDDGGRHTNQPKRKEWIENESFSQQKSLEYPYARGNQFSNDEKRTRTERTGPRDERDVDSSRENEYKHRESSRKNRESESGYHNSSIPSKRTRDEHSGKISKTVNLRRKTEEQKDKNENQIVRQSSRKQGEEGSSDDEHHDSRKGRSKFERWTSHKERDFFITSMSSSSLNNKDPDACSSRSAALANGFPEESSRKLDDKLHSATDDRDSGGEMKNSKAKLMEDKHLDTVEKLKKRSERFKLPMPSEKDAQAIKKTENEPLHSSQAENPQVSEIKSERPARKRRWTGN